MRLLTYAAEVPNSFAVAAKRPETGRRPEHAEVLE